MDDRNRPEYLPSIGEIHSIIGGVQTSKHIKSKLPSIINDQESSEKLIHNSEYLIGLKQ